MWGPWTYVRRWLRPLPTIGHAFRFRRFWPATNPRYRDFDQPRHGFVIDVVVRDADPEVARLKALDYVRASIDPEAELEKMRAADQRDFPIAMHLGQVGPRHHFSMNHHRLRS